MKLLLQTHLDTLRANGAANLKHREEDGHCEDFQPVVKVFCPWGAATWLLSEITEEDGDDTIFFGLCDLGMGSPELGYVSLAELQSVRGPGGLRIERDMHWTATAPLSAYASAANAAGRIIDQLKADAETVRRQTFAEECAASLRQIEASIQENRQRAERGL